MPQRLIDALVTTDAASDAFSDRALLQAMFDVEAVLARAEAAVGIIPAEAAVVITRAAVVGDDVDVAALVAQARAQATVSIPVVKLLTTRVEALDAGAARYVHWGATSQDVFDTAIVLCVSRAWPQVAADQVRLTQALDRLAGEHAGTVMLGRTLLQPAVPITFGLKAAGWLGAVTRTWRQWEQASDNLQVLQLGGAAGTLASLGSHGPAVERALADELGLAVPDAPWHAHRDRVAAFVAACGVHTATLGKIARDLSLLAQHEVGEASVAGGGSSTMPHKRNPSGCAVVLAAATRLPGIVASVLAGMVLEHERSVGGWHAEAPAVADAVQAAGSALAALADVVSSLRIDAARMRANIDATRGVVMAEHLALLLAPAIGRAKAADLAAQAAAESAASNRPLAVVVAGMAEAAAHLSPGDLERLASPDAYLGSADVFRRRLIDAARASSNGN